MKWISDRQGLKKLTKYGPGLLRKNYMV